MIVRVGGKKAGVMEYLESGKIRGRVEKRDEIDERVILAGEHGITKAIINKMEYQKNYYHITLSFKEDDVSREILEKIVEEAEEFFMSGFSKDEYNFYAEAHIPKMKFYYDGVGNRVERKPHIHIVVPRFNFKSMTQLKISENMKRDNKYIDAFQEYINDKYGLESPKRNRRKGSFSKTDALARYKKETSITLAATKVRNGLTSRIEADFLGGGIKCIDDVIRILREYRFIPEDEVDEEGNLKKSIRVVNGSNSSYLSVKVSGLEKSVRLKSVLFDPDFYKGDYYKTYMDKYYKNNDYQSLLGEWEELRKTENEKRYGKGRRRWEDLSKVIYEAAAGEELTGCTIYQIRKFEEMNSLYNYGLNMLSKGSLLLGKNVIIRKYPKAIFYYLKDRDIRITDRGGSISVKENRDVQAAVSALLDIAQAKNWELKRLKIEGGRLFRKEMKKQIEIRYSLGEGALSLKAVGFDTDNSVDLVRDSYSEQHERYIENRESGDKVKSSFRHINKNIDPYVVLKDIELKTPVKNIYYSNSLDRYVIESASGYFYSLVDFVKSVKGLDGMRLVEFFENYKEVGMGDELLDMISKEINPAYALKVLNIERKDNFHYFKGDNGLFFVRLENDKYVPLHIYLSLHGAGEAEMKRVLGNIIKLKKEGSFDYDEAVNKAKEIDLVEYLMANGFAVDKSKSSKTNTVLKNGKDVISVSIHNGHYVYYNFTDSKDKGSIIDFVSNHFGISDFKEALRHIGLTKDFSEFNSNFVDKPVITEDTRDKRDKISNAVSQWYDADFIIWSNYLKGRGIQKQHLIPFNKNVRTDSKKNVVFNLQGVVDGVLSVCGVSKYNKDFKRVFGVKGVWCNLVGTRAEKVFIVESPIDAISYQALKKDDNVLYIATMGKMGAAGYEALEEILKNNNINDKVQILLGLDNDEAGDTFTKELKDWFLNKELSSSVKIVRSEAKDWNEDLQILSKRTYKDIEL